MVRGIGAFNKVLVGKWRWRFLAGRDNLLTRVLESTVVGVGDGGWGVGNGSRLERRVWVIF